MTSAATGDGGGRLGALGPPRAAGAQPAVCSPRARPGAGRALASGEPRRGRSFAGASGLLPRQGGCWRARGVGRGRVCGAAHPRGAGDLRRWPPQAGLAPSWPGGLRARAPYTERGGRGGGSARGCPGPQPTSRQPALGSLACPGVRAAPGTEKEKVGERRCDAVTRAGVEGSLLLTVRVVLRRSY